ncbi:MAG: hypothetical protein AAFR44_14435, partial [Pseudomonadota bacterium]
PAFAAQWTALFAMMEALTVLFRPAGNGECLVLLPWCRRARQALMGVERVFRRLIADIAEAELEGAQPAARAKTATAAAPAAAASRPAPAPQDAPLASARHPLGRFQLHERQSPARYRGARGPDPLHDPFGVLELSLAGEMRRFARLVVAVSNPAPLIVRMRRILQRRQQAGLHGPARFPFRADWQPPHLDDLRPPGSPAPDRTPTGSMHRPPGPG